MRPRNDLTAQHYAAQQFGTSSGGPPSASYYQSEIMWSCSDSTENDLEWRRNELDGAVGGAGSNDVDVGSSTSVISDPSDGGGGAIGGADNANGDYEMATFDVAGLGLMELPGFDVHIEVDNISVDDFNENVSEE